MMDNTPSQSPRPLDDFMTKPDNAAPCTCTTAAAIDCPYHNQPDDTNIKFFNIGYRKGAADERTGQRKPDNAMAGELRRKQLGEGGALRVQIEQCFVGHNFPNTEIVVRILLLIAHERTRLLEDLEIEHTKELEACIASTRQDLLESLRREMPEHRNYISLPRERQEQIAANKAFNQAIDQVDQLLAKYVQGVNNEL